MGETSGLPARCQAEQAGCRVGVSFASSKGKLEEWNTLGLNETWQLS